MQPAHGILSTDYLAESHILNLLPAAVYVCDMSGVIKKYNEEAVKLWGRRPVLGDKDERFCGAYKLYLPDGTPLPHDQTPVVACLQDGIPRKDLEVIIERPDLSRVYVKVNIVPILDENGQQLGIINCFHDITAQKETEQKLQRKTAELQDYVDNASIGLHWVDAKGIIKWANQAELKMLGYTAEEYIGRHITEFHAAREKIEDILSRLARNETLNQYEAELRCKDGTVKTVHISSSVYRENGKFVHTRCFTVDVTAQKMLFQALAESEAKYRELAFSLERKVEEKIQDLKRKTAELKDSEERYHKMIEEVEDYAIILLDRAGIIQNWNKGAEKIKGYKEEEIVGKSIQEFYLPEDRERGFPQTFLEAAAKNGKAVHEGWRKKKDGSIFWGSVVLTAMHDEQRNVIGFSKVTRDLTEKKLAEDKMKEYMSQLEFQNRELEQFVYVASHDMKEPLRKIHLYNDFIANNAASQLDSRSREYLNRALHAAERMSSLIEDLLTYSRTASNVEHYDDVDLNRVVEEIVLLHKDESEQHNVKIEKDDLPVIRAVPFQIKQLMFNLVNNSIKYKHPDRDVVIKITNELVNGSAIADPRAKLAGQYYRITVADNGIGFAPRYADKIFQIFQRLDNLPGTKGSGIGLAICKKIVQNHKGFIQAMGKPDEGACFMVYLPRGIDQPDLPRVSSLTAR